LTVDHPYVLSGALALSRSTVDRSAHLRGDAEWMAKTWSDPATRVLLVGDGRVSVADGALRFVAPADAPDGERYLLGVDEEATFAAVRVPALAEDSGMTLREIGVDPPVSLFVRHRERVSRDLGSDAHVIELLRPRPQAGGDVSETLPITELGERHGEEMIPATEATHSTIALVASNAALKLPVRRVCHHLGKERLPLVHRRLP
jgi:hypothetical protein